MTKVYTVSKNLNNKNIILNLESRSYRDLLAKKKPLLWNLKAKKGKKRSNKK
jgi:hypothetical protein